MTPLNWLRYHHYRFWHRVLSVFPVYSDNSEQANRWCFVETSVNSIYQLEGSPGWYVSYRAGGRDWLEEGSNILQAIERAMFNAERFEKSMGGCGTAKPEVALPVGNVGQSGHPSTNNADDGKPGFNPGGSEGDDAPGSQHLLSDKSPPGASCGIADVSRVTRAEPDPAPNPNPAGLSNEGSATPATESSGPVGLGPYEMQMLREALAREMLDDPATLKQLKQGFRKREFSVTHRGRTYRFTRQRPATK